VLIVLEGCDGVGKTHLADQLLAEMNIAYKKGLDVSATNRPPEIVHRGVPDKEDMYEEYDLSWYTPGEGQNYILDRWHLGEWIYGRLYRGGSQLGLRGVRYIDRRLATAGALRLIVDADNITVRERLGTKNEEASRPQDRGYLKAQHVVGVLDEYRMAAQYLGWIKITSDYDPKSLIEWAASEEARVCGW
jgi:hypothetical protein